MDLSRLVEEITPTQFYSGSGMRRPLSVLQPSNPRIPYVWPLDVSSTASFDSVPHTSKAVPPSSPPLFALSTITANNAESAEISAPSPENADPLQHAGIASSEDRALAIGEQEREVQTQAGREGQILDFPYESEASALHRCKALLGIIQEKRPYAYLGNTGEAWLEVLTALQEKGFYKNRRNALPTLRDEMKELIAFKEFMTFEEVSELLGEPKRSKKMAKKGS